MVSLSLEHRLGQLLFIGIPGPTIDEETRQLLQTVQPGGIILFARNLQSPAQVAKLNRELRHILKVPPLISIDQEGGRVDRLKSIFVPMPSAKKLWLTNDARIAHEHGSLTAQALRLLGFNMNFAPVLDICVHPEAENALQERYFGRRTAEVIRIAGAYLEGLQNSAVIGCGKHFPGLGDSTVDSHEKLPVVSRSEEQMLAEDIRIYIDLSAKLNSQLQVVMVAHAYYPALEGPSSKRLPASLSPRIVTDLLRGRMEFHGLAISDDMEMGAISESMPFEEAIIKAVEAGEDMLLICQTPQKVQEAAAALTRAARDGRITSRRIDTSINRIARIKSMANSPLTFHIEQYEAVREKFLVLTELIDNEAASSSQ
jgi:beta-N-acetylhexosaminidase